MRSQAASSPYVQRNMTKPHFLSGFARRSDCTLSKCGDDISMVRKCRSLPHFGDPRFPDQYQCLAPGRASSKAAILNSQSPLLYIASPVAHTPYLSILNRSQVFGSRVCPNCVQVLKPSASLNFLILSHLEVPQILRSCITDRIQLASLPCYRMPICIFLSVGTIPRSYN